jgi:hypothetical protein
MSISGRGHGRSIRIPVDIQPTSTRVIPFNQRKRPYESSSDESSSGEVEWEEEQAGVSSAATQGIQLPALGQINTPEVPVRVRGRCRSDGGISEIAPFASVFVGPVDTTIPEQQLKPLWLYSGPVRCVQAHIYNRAR